MTPSSSSSMRSCQRHRSSSWRLLALLAAWLLCGASMHSCGVSATQLPARLHAAARVRTTSHLASERLRRQAPARESMRGAPEAAAHQGHARSTLQRVTTGDSPPSLGNPPSTSALPTGPSSSSTPIRILPELQLPAAMSAANRTKTTQAITAAILTLQSYLQVRRPVGPSGLLVAPQYYGSSTCSQINQQNSGSLTCAGPGFYPTFSTSLPQTDILAPYCGSALINPAHVMSAQACAVQSGPATGSVDPTCTVSAAGTIGGTQTDMYLYVTSDSSNCDTSVLAYASTCLYDLYTNRPVMSYFNVCPLALVALTPQQLVSTMVHELTHALGFSPDLWNPSGTANGPSLFISASGATLPASKVVATLPADPNRGPGSRPAVAMIVTPTVVAEVRSHFGCPTLPGAALEDQGGAGSAGSHWEFDLFQGEIMTPQAPADGDWQHYTRITLALMQDSGWYWGNWSLSPPLDWGSGAGCAMPQLTCSRYAATVPQQPYYCDAVQGGTGCTYNGRSWGICHQDQTFSRCGIITTAASGGVVEPACVSPAYAMFGTVGPDVRCVPSLVGPSLFSVQWPCRPASCTAGTASTNGGTASAGGTTGDVLTFTNAPQTLVCPSSANGTAPAGSSGCPSNVTEVCDTLQCPASGCSATGGDCLDGACVCRLGFTGATCANALVDGVLPQLGYAVFAPPPPPLAAGPGARPAGVAAVLGAALLAVLLPLLVMA